MLLACGYAAEPGEKKADAPAALVTPVVLSEQTAPAADSEKVKKTSAAETFSDNKSTAEKDSEKEDAAALFPHEIPFGFQSWMEYRLKNPQKPEHTTLLRTVLPRRMKQPPEEFGLKEEQETSPGQDAASVTTMQTPENAPQAGLKLLDSFIATAYYLTGLTSTGAYTTVNHTLAVNPNIIPYGTHVWIWLEDGTYVGDFYAEDTGSNMMAHPYVIDIYMGNDYNACVQWGARNVLVYVEDDAA